MAISDKSKANLRPWPKGVSGNPSGRPKARPISDAYEALANLPIPTRLARKLKLPKGSTWREALAYAQFQKALEGMARNATEIREAIEGKATQRIEVAATDLEGFKVTVRLVKPKDGSH